MECSAALWKICGWGPPRQLTRLASTGAAAGTANDAGSHPALCHAYVTRVSTLTSQEGVHTAQPPADLIHLTQSPWSSLLHTLPLSLLSLLNPTFLPACIGSSHCHREFCRWNRLITGGWDLPSHRHLSFQPSTPLIASTPPRPDSSPPPESLCSRLSTNNRLPCQTLVAFILKALHFTWNVLHSKPSFLNAPQNCTKDFHSKVSQPNF